MVFGISKVYKNNLLNPRLTSDKKRIRELLFEYVFCGESFSSFAKCRYL